MHSYYSRINTVFFTTVYCLAAVSVLYAVLKASKPFKGELLQFENATVNAIMSDLQDIYIFPMITLNIHYDLSKDWDYNTRSIYAYVVISFTGDNESHELILWDKIMMSKEDCVFKGTIKNKGILYNDDPTLLGKEATISFHYQIQPTVGFQRDYVFDQVQKVIIENKD